ncbi:MAG: OmpA family protein [Pseudomonadales bacterium]|jgi:OOP family OmpA-OmpF porin|tara:strand:+ start:103 stop:1221 length:1119 start_codon:yes stop_codon:yes gene_type:complete
MIKSTRKSAAMVGLSMVLMAGSLAAKEEPGITVSPMIGYTWLGDGVEDTDHWSLGLGYQFDSPWAIELVYADAETDFEKLAGDVDFTRWHVDGLYHLNTWGDVRPYLSFGVGEGDYDFSSLSSESNTLFNVGAGVKYAFAKNTAVRADLKMFEGDGFEPAQAAFAVGIHHVFARSIGNTVIAPTPLDSDQDGVYDDVDQCPGTVMGIMVDGLGCEKDDDKDGVLNSVDECPDTTNTKAKIDSKGCYVRLMETVAIELDVEFDFDSSKSRAEHQSEVKRVSDFMQMYPDTMVVIEGHTDSRGDEDYNMALSQDRAETIASMLVNEFGISVDRVKAVGVGEGRPLAPNDTAEGRQINRRVIGVVEATVEVLETR